MTQYNTLNVKLPNSQLIKLKLGIKNDCMLLSCHVKVNLHTCESKPTLYSLSEYQGTPWSKQVTYLMFKGQQQDSNSQRLSSETKTQPFSQTGVNCWVFVNKLSGCGFDSHCYHVKIVLKQLWNFIKCCWWL